MEHDVNLIVDIEEDEAEELIRLIELLIQAWYIEDHEARRLYSDIVGINQAAQKKHSS